ncbi:ASCH domain-containing protein [Pseudomonas flavescens]|uniref:ASCH domain-containing protein n=1 Tax=Phytopseudomonas flavescens TaxID=29435 RepID=A0A1G7XSJ4_9GAMM|nr:ASCH domain-containing protein [Pseudomonas flavescens]SDG87205.1 ASCH domain-containing protein [Pseudomonas flavescens]
MKALSIRQPWAWLIIHGSKDIENRTWHTKFRGRFLVHAAQGMTRKEYEFARDFALQTDATLLPPFEDLQRGGIIGSVELVDSVDHSKSRWYMGEKGFVLQDPKPLPFMPLKGRLGFFDVDYAEPYQ